MSSQQVKGKNEMLEKAAEDLALLFIAQVEQIENKEKSKEIKNESRSKI